MSSPPPPPLPPRTTSLRPPPIPPKRTTSLRTQSLAEPARTTSQRSQIQAAPPRTTSQRSQSLAEPPVAQQTPIKSASCVPAQEPAPLMPELYPPGSPPTSEAAAEIKTERDCFFTSPNVHKLTSCNYDDFLRAKDVVLVMYYNPASWEATWSGVQFSAASRLSASPNRVYAAVDCCADSLICQNENIRQTTPVFKLFTKNKLVTTETDFIDFRTYRMMQYMKLAPNVEEYTAPKGARTRKHLNLRYAGELYRHVGEFE